MYSLFVLNARTDKFNWNDYKLKRRQAKNIKINNNVQFVEKNFARQKMIKHEDLNDLLIIAGSDNYPKILLEAARKFGIKNIHVIAFKGETKKEI